MTIYNFIGYFALYLLLIVLTIVGISVEMPWIVIGLLLALCGVAAAMIILQMWKVPRD